MSVVAFIWMAFSFVFCFLFLMLMMLKYFHLCGLLLFEIARMEITLIAWLFAAYCFFVSISTISFDSLCLFRCCFLRLSIRFCLFICLTNLLKFYHSNQLLTHLFSAFYNSFSTQLVLSTRKKIQNSSILHLVQAISLFLLPQFRNEGIIYWAALHCVCLFHFCCCCKSIFVSNAI